MMPRRLHIVNTPLIKLSMECVVGQINTNIVDNQIPVVLERMKELLNKSHYANLDGRELKLPELSNNLLELSARLVFLSEQRLEEIAEEKIKYAPHPTFISS